jgi:hypothetical protein
MRRAVVLLFIVLPACLPVAAPEGGADPDLPTPSAPAALVAPVDEGAEVAGDGLFEGLPEPVASGEMLGRVIVSPGNAGEPGLWLRTSRTSRAAQGTVVAGNGVSANVLLIPADGVSLLSAEAYRALGLTPGTFAEVTIYLR